MLRKLMLVASALLCLVAVNLRADEVLLEQFYGDGVHAYNQGDYIGAYNSLSSAIKGGTNDPRAYYFRGLAYLKLGRDPEAKVDFQAGAELEVGDSADVYPVNRSLERVQGRSRQVLEQYRTSVHAAAVQRREAERQVRYEQRAAAEQDVLRQVSPAQLPSDAIGTAPSRMDRGAEASKSIKSDDSLGNDATESEKKSSDAQPAQPSTNSTPAGNDNPFGEPTPKKGAVPTPTPTPSDDPFGTPQSASPPAKTPAGAMPSPAEHNDNGAVQPTAGGLGSLMRAVAKGSKSDQPALPAGAAPSLPDMIHGMFGAGATNSPAAQPAIPATPPAVDNGGPPPPQNTMPQGEAPPAATIPAPAAGTPMPGAEQPKPPATNTPQQANPTPPPKDNDNPFN